MLRSRLGRAINAQQQQQQVRIIRTRNGTINPARSYIYLSYHTKKPGIIRRKEQSNNLRCFGALTNNDRYNNYNNGSSKKQSLVPVLSKPRNMLGTRHATAKYHYDQQKMSEQQLQHEKQQDVDGHEAEDMRSLFDSLRASVYKTGFLIEEHAFNDINGLAVPAPIPVSNKEEPPVEPKMMEHPKTSAECSSITADADSRNAAAAANTAKCDISSKPTDISDKKQQNMTHEKQQQTLTAPAGNTTTSTTTTTISSSSASLLQQNITRALAREDFPKAIELFETAVSTGEIVSLDVVKRLCSNLSRNGYPFHCHQLLQYYKQHPDRKEDDDKHVLLLLYKHVCQSIRYIKPGNSLSHHLQRLTQKLEVELLREVTEDIKRQCIPVLISSLLEQRLTDIGKRARYLYDILIREYYQEDGNSNRVIEKPITANFFEHLLTLSRYNRCYDLPFCDIMQKAVKGGRTPPPKVALNVLENFYPYMNIDSTIKVFQAILTLQQQQQQQQQHQQQQNEQDNQQQRYHEYVIDTATLECIGAAAVANSHANNAELAAELILSLWDYIDLMKVEPTESIYESTILTFVNHPTYLENAFLVLLDMESKLGKPISRTLVRSISLMLRKDRSKIEEVHNIINGLFMKCLPNISISVFNVLLSICAEQGNSKAAMMVFHQDILNNMMNYNTSNDKVIKPDADTFSYVLEALGKDFMWKQRKVEKFYTPQPGQDNDDAGGGNQKTIHKSAKQYLDQADHVLSIMEEQSNFIQPTQHVIRNYVELLCLTGNVETATLIVKDYLDQHHNKNTNDEAFPKTVTTIIDNKTLYRVAVANAELGNFQLARKLANMTSEPNIYLDDKINQIEDGIHGGWEKYLERKSLSTSKKE